MAEESQSNIIDSIKNFFKTGIKPGAEEAQARMVRREKIVVFTVALVLAIFLWLFVNLSGNFNISLNIPIEPGNVPEDMALTEDLPEFVQVSLNGNGWQLLSLYNDPPTLVINIEEGEINLFDQVRQRLSYLQEVDVSKVQPLLLSVDMEPKISKRVPIKLNTQLNFQSRYGLIGEPQITPDSITIIGAESHLSSIDEWEVPDTLRLKNIRDDINQTIPLQARDPLIEISAEEITFEANVSEYTEGETTVYIRTRNLPRGQNINYNPSSVTIRFDVPLEQYNEVEKIKPYEVYVPYSKIVEDSTGFVTPDIELTATQYELKVRSFQPKAVAYFSVLDQ